MSKVNRQSEIRKNQLRPVKIIKGYPPQNIGKDGDLVLSLNTKGLVLLIKANKKWYKISNLEGINEGLDKKTLDQLECTTIKNRKPGPRISKDADKIRNITLRAADKVVIDKNTIGPLAEDATGLHVDFDRTVATSGTNVHNDIGIDLDVNSASLGTSTVTGMDIDVVGATSGNHSAIGIDLDVDGADTNTALKINTAGTHIKLVANADADDYATFALADTGDLTIATEGDGSLDSDLTLDVDGNLILDPATGVIKFYKAGDTDDLCTLTVAANGATTIATADSDGAAGNLTLDADGGIIFDSHGGTFNFYRAGDTNDFCRLSVEADGVTTIATADSDGAVGHLTLQPDGNLILQPYNDCKIGPKTGNVYVYDSDNADDYFHIDVNQHGATLLTTIDAAGADASLKLAPDGDLLFDSTTANAVFLNGNIKLAEKSDAMADTAGFGQLWVHDDTPNTLWFTTDAGDDIQLTSGTSVAGGGGAISVATVTISEAEMNALHTTEKVLVAAQGANQVIIPSRVTAFIDRDGSTAQSNGVHLYISADGETTAKQWFYFKSFMRAESGDRVITPIMYTGENSQTLTGLDNTPLTAKLTGAITSGSIDSCKMVVEYYVYDNS